MRSPTCSKRAGLATVALAGVRGQAEAARAPRSLYGAFPLGRPLGKPNDPEFQKAVLAAAFALLDRRSGPVLEDFPGEPILDEVDEVLSCPLPPYSDPSLPRAVDEAVGLRAAYSRNLAATGRTGVVRTGDADGIRSVVETFLALAGGATAESLSVDAAWLSGASMDLRAYYEEAALALADHVPAARQTEIWFFDHTAAGAALRNAQAALKAADAPKGQWMGLVPAHYTS